MEGLLLWLKGVQLICFCSTCLVMASNLLPAPSLCVQISVKYQLVDNVAFQNHESCWSAMHCGCACSLISQDHEPFMVVMMISFKCTPENMRKVVTRWCRMHDAGLTSSVAT